MKKLSVHINRKLTPNLRHNDRSTKETHQNVFAEKSSLNQCDKSAKEAMREINQLYKEAMEKMKGKKGKRTPKENSYLEMIFEVDENHTLEDCQRLADEICEITNFRRIQITLHKDEGHYEKDGSFKTHYHAHAVFFTLDKEDGKQLARREKSLSDTNLANFHKLAYKVLRGEEKIKGEKKEYINDYREYKKIKAKEQELEEKELEQLERVNKFFDYKEQEEPRLEALAEELAQKEEKLAQKEEEISQAIENLEKEKKSFLKLKEQLKQEIQSLEQYKEELLGKSKEAHKQILQKYENNKSKLKNFFTLGRHHKKLKEQRDKEETFLANVTKLATEESDNKIKEILALNDDLNNIIKEQAKEIRAITNERDKAQSQVKELKQRLEKYEWKTINPTYTKTKTKENEYEME